MSDLDAVQAVAPVGEPEVGTVAVLGGTGALGRGLAYRFAAAGLGVVLGSRDDERAAEVAAHISRSTGGEVRGTGNADAATAAHVVVVAVPWDAHAPLLRGLREELAGRVVVDCVNPLGFDEHGPYALDVPEGSAAQQAAALLPDSAVVAAFHHVSARLLCDADVDTFDLDVLVLGDDDEACARVEVLVGCLPGARGVRAGRLRDARQVEGLAANLIAVNRRQRGHAGLRVTGTSD